MTRLSVLQSRNNSCCWPDRPSLWLENAVRCVFDREGGMRLNQITHTHERTLSPFHYLHYSETPNSSSTTDVPGRVSRASLEARTLHQWSMKCPIQELEGKICSFVKGIVHPNIFWKCIHPQAVQDVVCLFIGTDLEKYSNASLSQQWMLCSEWVPSEWASKQLIKTSQ